jgi:hypothetical protein
MTGSSRRSFFREGSLLKKSLMNLFARQSKEKKLYSRRNEAAYPSEKPRIGKLSLFGLSIRAINSHPSGSYWVGGGLFAADKDNSCGELFNNNNNNVSFCNAQLHTKGVVCGSRNSNGPKVDP